MDDDAARPHFAEISTAFPTVPESVAAARRFVTVSLRRFDFSADALQQAALVTSELVASAFSAGGPPIRIRVRAVAESRAMVEVTHGVDDAPPDDSEEPGERLHLTPAGQAVVESMATRWGTRPSGTGVLAWFEIDDGPPAGGGSRPGAAVPQGV
jgi:anti-sigma regulatory factor (Ser/Thr protein kinase)